MGSGDDSDSDDSTMNAGVIVAIVTGVLAAIAIIALIVYALFGNMAIFGNGATAVPLSNPAGGGAVVRYHLVTKSRVRYHPGGNVRASPPSGTGCDKSWSELVCIWQAPCRYLNNSYY